MEMDFNFKEEKLFNECIDSITKIDPKKFCLETIVPLTKFELWTTEDTDRMC
jgi:hypothetical protein